MNVSKDKLTNLVRQRDELLASTRVMADELATVTHEIDELLCGIRHELSLPLEMLHQRPPGERYDLSDHTDLDANGEP